MEPTEESSRQEKLQYWIEALTEREMPVFAQTARLIATEAGDNQRSAAELAELVLQDVSMTARLLRVANSIIANPNRTTISTVSRAIVLLGFETVRNICFSIAIIDAMSHGAHHANVVREMARAFHAATQARTMAVKRRDHSPEEVFIATLLFQLGHMAFWCFAGTVDAESAERLQQALAQADVDPVEAERRVLGFSLKELTGALNRHWHLSSLLEDALQPNPTNTPRATNVTLAHQVARAAEEGWDTPHMKQLLDRVAEALYLPRDKVNQLVRDNARAAVSSMAKLGAADAGRLVPLPKEARPPAVETNTETPSDSGKPSRFPSADAELQMQILRELSDLMTDDHPNINLVFEMALEGIHRGVGMDRTLFALLSPDRTTLRSKYAIGWDRQQLAQQFRFKLNTPVVHIMDHVIHTQQPLWVRFPAAAEFARMVTADVQAVTGDSDFVLMPIAVRGKTIGLFYADRRPSRRALDDEAFTSFKLFGQQARLGLNFVKGG